MADETANASLGLPEFQRNSWCRTAARIDEGAGDGSARSLVLSTLGVAVAYLVGTKLGLALTLPPRPTAVFWPPNAILLAALLLHSPSNWWMLLAAVLPAHWVAEWSSGVPGPMVACWYVSNCCEALIGAACIRRVVGPIQRFDLIRTVIVFCVFGGVVGPLLSSFLDAGFVQLNSWGQAGYWQVWRMRSASNILSALVITPAIVNWHDAIPRLRRKISLAPALEIGALSAGFLITSLCLYILPLSSLKVGTCLIYSSVPFLLWAALRFGSLGASTAMLFTTVLAIWGAAHGHGPFADQAPQANALAMQLCFTPATALLLMLGAAVEERSRAEDRSRKAFLLCPDPMLICRKSDGTVTDTNKRWQDTMGFVPDSHFRSTILDLDIYRSELDRERLRTCLSEQQPFRDLELCLRGGRGGNWQAIASGDVAEIAGESCFIIVMRDITDRKKAQEAIENLAHMSRLAVVGELTAMIAHEVNQPLGAIRSNADAAEMILAKDPSRIDEIQRILIDIRKDDARASQAIFRIRSLLRRKQMQMELLDLNEAVRDVMTLVTGDALRRRVRLQTKLSRHLPALSADRAHLQQVLLNLIVNGMDAMQEIPESQRRLIVRTVAKADTVEISVQDSGPGIKAESLPRLFESFFTTKSTGMGLGLAISRSIIETHGGKIWAENSPERGAVFSISLPAANSTPQAHEK